MLDRELTYHVPFKRLAKLSRTMSRKAFGSVWWATWLWILAALATLPAMPLIEGRLAEAAWPDGAVFAAWMVLFFAGFIAIRVWGRRQAKSRADYDAEARFRQDAGGLRIGTNSIEYYLKWPGIAQVLIESDGLVVSHGNLFFLVPDSAFASLGERNELVREIFANLSQEAKDRSIAHVKSILAAPAGGT